MAEMGRPTKYSEELGKKICKELASGKSLKRICEKKEYPTAKTVYNWLLDKDKKDFLHNYESARNIQADLMFDDLLDIADDGTNDYYVKENKDGSIYKALNSEHVQRSRLRVDTRKWYLSKVLPKKYGEKLDLTSGGERMPAPLLANIDVSNNNSNKENSKDGEEDKSSLWGDISEQNNINSSEPNTLSTER